MELKQSTLMYFSPTGSTAQVIRSMADHSAAPVSEVNLTPIQDPCRRSFDDRELLIIGIPVFGGRIPPVVKDRLAYIKGADTPAVVVATYGNRHYDDALRELSDFLSAKGFVTIAGAAVVTRHSIVPTIAEGRPDEGDYAAFNAFTEQVFERIAAMEQGHPEAVTLPGNPEYKDFKGIPFKPITNMDCVACCACVAVCPMGAIPMDSPSKTIKEKCITCMACVWACPKNARALGKMDILFTKQHIGKTAKVHKDPEFFL
jgi:ferredoxin